MKLKEINVLNLSWSVSRGRDTYGYNICRLDDRNNSKRYRTLGSGYDLIGTVFGEWLEDNFQEDLLKLKDRVNGAFTKEGYKSANNPESLYGLFYNEKDNTMSLDGGCGIDRMLKIGEAVGLDFDRNYVTKGRNYGQTTGWYVQKVS